MADLKRMERRRYLLVHCALELFVASSAVCFNIERTLTLILTLTLTPTLTLTLTLTLTPTLLTLTRSSST